MDLTDIKALAEEYLEWPSDKREMVTYTSAMIFAWQVMKDREDQMRNEIAELRRRVDSVQHLADKIAAESVQTDGGPGEEIQLGRFQVLDELLLILR